MIRSFFLLICLGVLCACSSAKEPVLGSWTLDKVYAGASGEEMTEQDPESAASLFGDLDGYYTFEEDGSAVHGYNGGGEFVEDKGTWKKDEDNAYIYTDDNSEMSFVYSSETDTLHSYWSSDNPDDAYAGIEYIYTRKK